MTYLFFSYSRETEISHFKRRNNILRYYRYYHRSIARIAQDSFHLHFTFYTHLYNFKVSMHVLLKEGETILCDKKFTRNKLEKM